MLCHCKLPARKDIKTKPGPTFGKQFLSCSKPTGDSTRCHFFQWDTSTAPTPSCDIPVQHTHPGPILPPAVVTTLTAPVGAVRASTKASLSFLAPDRISVACAYRDDIISSFRHLKGKFDSSRKEWVFPLATYDALVSTLSALSEVTVVPLPPHVIAIIHAPQSAAPLQRAPSGLATSQIPHLELRIPRKLKETLLSFQTSGVEYCVAKNGRAMICDEMGCGKTLTALATACHYAEEWPLLIICPSSLRLNWRDECMKYLPGRSPASISIINTGKDKLPEHIPTHPFAAAASKLSVVVDDEAHLDHAHEDEAFEDFRPTGRLGKRVAARRGGRLTKKARVAVIDSDTESDTIEPEPAGSVPKDPLFAEESRRFAPPIVIISYDLVATFVKAGTIRPQQFQVVIADESHSLKSMDAKRTQATLPILQQAKRTLVLSGTPALNRPRELFTQISAVKPHLFASYRDFAVRYCNGSQRPWGFDDSGSSNLDELRMLLEQHCMIRRLKCDILKDLPPKCRRVFHVDIHSGAKAQITQLRAELAKLDGQSRAASSETERQIISNKRRGVLANIYRTTGIGKLPAIVAHILNIVRPLGRPRKSKALSAKFPSSSPSKDDITYLLGDDVEEAVDLTQDSDGDEGGGFVVDEPDAVKPAINASPAKEVAPRAWGKAFNDAAAVKSSADDDTDEGDSVEQVTKLVVFAHHKEVLSYIEKALKATDPPIQCVRIDGTTDASKKQIMKNAFQDNPAIQVALIGLTAAGVGLSFTAASTALFAELHWTPGILAQAEDRIHRIGQKAPSVHIQYLVSPDVGVDQQMWTLVVKKLETIYSTLDAEVRPSDAVEEGEQPADPLAGIDCLDAQVDVAATKAVLRQDTLSFFNSGQTKMSQHFRVEQPNALGRSVSISSAVIGPAPSQDIKDLAADHFDDAELDDLDDDAWAAVDAIVAKKT